MKVYAIRKRACERPAVGLIVTPNSEDIFWNIDEFDNPYDYEYTELSEMLLKKRFGAVGVWMAASEFVEVIDGVKLSGLSRESAISNEVDVTEGFGWLFTDEAGLTWLPVKKSELVA